jgi:pimeloyl-ACP methyl ester carboxylesterase
MMTQNKEKTLLRVKSHDGTEIGYWTSGEGPPLLLVHGGVGDNTRWDALLPYLEPHFTVSAMDRSGRGASGDHTDWAIEREYEDVAAVIDAISQDTGSPIAVYGHSGGGFCSFKAVGTGLTENIDRLILYEGWPLMDPNTVAPPIAYVEKLEALLEADQRDAIVEALLRDVVKMGPEEIETYRNHPSWANRVASAHTLPRELRAFRELVFDPEEAARITVPVLMLSGTTGADWGAKTVAQSLPNARVIFLEGQGHSADITAPQVITRHILPFLNEGRSVKGGVS